MIEFDEESLAEFDGREGRPAYVVVDGRVHDVSASTRWVEGLHMRRHHAGADLTADLSAAPHGPEKLERFPRVGVLARPVAPDTGPGLPPFVVTLLERFPVLRRHPHPMTVHFPIVFAFSSFFFAFLQILFGAKSLGTTAFHCLVAGALFTPVAMMTGFATWKINYLGKPMAPVWWKLRLSFVLWALFCGGSIWQFAVPGEGKVAGAMFGGAAAACAAVLGWIGASLTFPVRPR